MLKSKKILPLILALGMAACFAGGFFTAKLTGPKAPSQSQNGPNNGKAPNGNPPSGMPGNEQSGNSDSSQSSSNSDDSTSSDSTNSTNSSNA